jgi:hypothetical protein
VPQAPDEKLDDDNQSGQGQQPVSREWGKKERILEDESVFKFCYFLVNSNGQITFNSYMSNVV